MFVTLGGLKHHVFAFIYFRINEKHNMLSIFLVRYNETLRKPESRYEHIIVIVILNQYYGYSQSFGILFLCWLPTQDEDRKLFYDVVC